MEDILEKIVTEKKRRLMEQGEYPLFQRVEIMAQTNAQENRFLSALTVSPGPNIIAEVKFASPSRGRLLNDLDLYHFIEFYQQGGAAAISVVTEERYFLGKPKLVSRVRAKSSLPILRKDFVIEEAQIYQSAQLGADALLLIARILPWERLAHFVDLCSFLGLVPLVEVHDEADVEKAILAGAQVVGINNRDLASFKVSLETTFHLSQLLPDNVIVVSESGIRRKEDITRIMERGICNFLIGECLLASAHPMNKLIELQGREVLGVR